LHAANEVAEHALRRPHSFGAGEGRYKSDFWWELLVIWCSRLELIKMKKIHVRINKPKLLSKCNAVHLHLLEKLL
jgi:hypothetical protein